MNGTLGFHELQSAPSQSPSEYTKSAQELVAYCGE